MCSCPIGPTTSTSTTTSTTCPTSTRNGAKTWNHPSRVCLMTAATTAHPPRRRMSFPTSPAMGSRISHRESSTTPNRTPSTTTSASSSRNLAMTWIPIRAGSLIRVARTTTTTTTRSGVDSPANSSSSCTLPTKSIPELQGTLPIRHQRAPGARSLRLLRR